MLPEPQTNQHWQDRQLIVWGLGKTGNAVARFLGCVGAYVSVVDRASEPSKATEDALSGLDVACFWGGREPTPEQIRAAEAIILSPGVPYDLPALIEARNQGTPTIAAMQWAISQLQPAIPTIAVTGTAGKTTTVSLLGAMMKASGFQTFVGGNIGTPLISIVPTTAHEKASYQRLVLECSSFQLEASTDLNADVSLLTNISDNHLDRHGTMAAYSACKARLFDAQGPSQTAITWADQPECLRIIGGGKASRALLYTQDEGKRGAAMTEDGFLLRLNEAQTPEHYSWKGFRLRGCHNRENAMAAALAARLSGATPEGITQALQTFAALSHRLEEIDAPGDVHFFNDSKSTTPESTAKALAAFDPTNEPVHLLLGGRSKGADFGVLAPLLLKRTKAVYLFGEAADEIGAALAEKVTFTTYPSMEDALHSAANSAQAGDNIVLSPACASFDQFANFEARGDAFKAWVHQHTHATTHSTPTAQESPPS